MAGTQQASTDITVNVDGLWLLQALVGVTQLAPELRGRPYGEPRSGREWISRHPGLAVLVEQGICDEAGVVRSDIAERMAVVAVPDVEVIILVSRGPLDWSPRVSLEDEATWRAVPDEQLRIVLARRAGRWASEVRAGDQITIDDFGGGDADRLARLVSEGLDSIGVIEPAKFSAVNVPLDEMKGAAAQRLQASDARRRDAPLRAVGLRGAALAVVGAALDDPLAEAVVYGRAYVDTITVMSQSVLDVRDTEAGRIAMFRLNPPRGSRQEWMSIGPATPAQVCYGVGTVLASVAVRSWETHARLAL